MTAIFASGDIKKYQVYVTFWGGLVFPITWVAYKLGATPESTYIIYFIIYCIVLYVRLRVVQQKINLPMIQYLKIVLARFIPVAILSILISLVVPFIMPPSILRILVTTLISCIAIGLVVYLIGLTTEERRMVIEKVRKIVIDKR